MYKSFTAMSFALKKNSLVRATMERKSNLRAMDMYM